jgi:hypothetical protein
MRDIIVKRITPQTFCALAPIMPSHDISRSMTSREEGQTGRKIARTSRATASYADVFLRVLSIDIAFSREGHAGSRIIRIRRSLEKTVCTVSSVRDYGTQVWTTSAATGQ